MSKFFFEVFMRCPEVLKSVIIGMKGVLECYRILRGVVELSLWCLMMSKYVSDEDASYP
jgi:hypothetical protein